MARAKVQYNGYTVYKGVEWNYDKKTLTVKMSPGGAPRGYKWDQLYKKTWENYCPCCKKSGLLRAIGAKGLNTAIEGEIDCTGCTADFDGVTGYEKINGSTKRLKEGSSTSSSAISNQLSELNKLKDEYKTAKSPKRNMTLKIPPIKGIKDGHCHQLSPPLVSKDKIVYVESVEITEKEVVMQVNDKLEAPGEVYNPPSENKSGSSNYNATTKAEKEMVLKGQELKAASDLTTVKNVERWIREHITYKYYYNWNAGSGDPATLDKTTLAKRWNSKSGNCVFCAWLFYIMCQGADVTVEIWNGDATFGSGKTTGHLWNKYKGTVYDGASSTSRNFRNAKKIK